MDPNNPEDIKQVNALEDAIRVRQKNAGTFEVPNWDPGSQNYIWIDGEYTQPPRPGAQWVAGHWTQTADSWVWTNDHWN